MSFPNSKELFLIGGKVLRIYGGIVMKKKLYLLLGVFILFVITTSIVTISAAEIQLDFDELEQHELDRIIEEYQFELSNTPVSSIDFCCFDVNSNGKYAIGFSVTEGRWLGMYTVGKISVYSSDNKFEYCLTFKTPGAFDIILDENVLVIYSVRDELMLWVDDGELIDAKAVLKTEKNRKYLNSVLEFKNKTVNNTIYSAKTGKDFIDKNESVLSGEYSVLVKKTSDTEEILYENQTNDTISLGLILLVVGLVITVLGGVATIICLFVVRNKKRKITDKCSS